MAIITHEYNSEGQHRLTSSCGAIGRWTLNQHPAFLLVDGETYVSFSSYYEHHDGRILADEGSARVETVYLLGRPEREWVRLSPDGVWHLAYGEGSTACGRRVGRCIEAFASPTKALPFGEMCQCCAKRGGVE